MIPVLESIEFYRYARSLQAHVLTGKSFFWKKEIFVLVQHDG